MGIGSRLMKCRSALKILVNTSLTNPGRLSSKSLRGRLLRPNARRDHRTAAVGGNRKLFKYRTW